MMDTTLDEQRAIVAQRQEAVRQTLLAAKLAQTLARVKRLTDTLANAERQRDPIQP